MYISINPHGKATQFETCPCQSKLYNMWSHTRTSCGFSAFNTSSPWVLTIRVGKASNTKQSRCRGTGHGRVDTAVTGTGHGRVNTAVTSTCWGGQPSPLACYSADQGQAGDQIKVLVWGELGPGAREAAWEVDAHTSETQWRASRLALL